MKLLHPFYLRKKSWTKVPERSFKYSEDILQWLWGNLLFDTANLKTTEGKSVSVFDAGVLNPTDGPDFLNAKILIDGIIWHGAIELHLKSSGWKQHGHHLDHSYNKVILHVVVENSPHVVYPASGGEIPTLNLIPYLPDGLSEFVSDLGQFAHLPCSNKVAFISEGAFLKQIDKAHTEYFEKKGNDFLSFYDPELAPSQAWKHALVLSVFDGFGISHNREPMQQVGRWMLSQNNLQIEELIEGALRFAGFLDAKSKLNWNFKGIFPASHPQKRIPESIKIAVNILTTPFHSFMSANVLSVWNKWFNEAGLSGSSKQKILYATVFLPALYVLGNLFAAKKMSELAFSEWQNYKAPIPENMLRKFQSITDLNRDKFARKLGAVHQLNAYCKPRRCHECFVLKKVISS